MSAPFKWKGQLKRGTLKNYTENPQCVSSDSRTKKYKQIKHAFVLFLVMLIELIQKIAHAEQSHSNPVLEKPLQNAQIEKTVINGQEYLNVKFAGSLEPNFDLNCISMKEVSNKFNPAALMLAAKKCVLQNNHERVWNLINTANGFAYYALKRLADRSLKGVLMVLSYKFSESLTPSKGEAARKITFADEKKFKNIALNS